MNLITQETRPQPDNTRLIPLTKGQFALVDEADYESLKQYKWQAQWNNKTKSYYAIRTTPQVNKKGATTVRMHRQILGLAIGDKRFGDHRNHNTLDNRRDNLRIASTYQNQHNRKVRKDSTSGYKGVTPFGDQWKAEIRVNGKWIYLGLFDTPEGGRDAYFEAADEHQGKFSFHHSITRTL